MPGFVSRVVPLALVACCALVLAAPPALADGDDDLPDAGSAPTMGGMPDPAKLQGQLGGLEKQLAGQESHGGGSVSRLLHIVQAIKNGGQGVTAEDIAYLRDYLRKIGAESSNPDLGPALEMMGQQLEQLQQQRAHPDQDPMEQLLNQ